MVRAVSSSCGLHVALVFAVLVLCAAPATAQIEPPAASAASPPAAAALTNAESLTVAEIEARRKEAEASTELADDVKKKIADLYRQALEQLQQAEQTAAAAAKHKAAAEGVQTRVVDIRCDLEALQTGAPEPAPDVSLSALEPKLSAKELQLNELKASLVKLEAEQAARSARRKELRTLLLASPQKLDDVKKQIAAPSPADEPPPLTRARRGELLARRTLCEQQNPAYQFELARFDAEEAADLLRLQRDLLAQQIARAQQEFELLGRAVRRKRDEEAQLAVRRAHEEAVRAEPLLKPYADENQAFAQAAQALGGSIADTEAKLKQAKTLLEELQRRLAQTRQKVDSVGNTGAIGLMLRKQRGELPDVRRHRRAVAERGQLIDALQFAQFEYDDQRSQLADPEPLIRQVLASAKSDLNRAEREQLEGSARHVLERQCEYLDGLIRSHAKYFDTLVELDSTERQLISLTEEYAEYIDRRVLWIRSAKPLYADLRLEAADFHVVSPGQWSELGKLFIGDVRSAPFVYGGALALLICLIAAGMRAARDIAAMGEIACRGSSFQFLPTIRAACWTVLISLPLPGVLLFVSWRLSPLAEGSALAAGLVEGCWFTAWTWAVLGFLRQLCRPNGLAEAHFGWPEAPTQRLRRELRVLMLLAAPLVLLTTTLQAADPEHGQDVVERIASIVGSVLLMVFLYRLLSPGSGMLREFVAYRSGGWLDRLKHVWCCIGVGGPALLAALSLFGYHYTARQLAFRLFVTVALVLAMIVVRGLLLRLVLVSRRKLSIREARRRRAESAEASASQDSVGGLNPQSLIAAADQGPDIKAHSAQTNRLVITAMTAAAAIGLWLTWSDVIPALGALDGWPLWSTTVVETEIVPAADGAAETTRTRERVEAITLADVGLAALIAIVTLIAARNFPGLLEMSVLQRLPLETSVRYAITTLASYGIVLVGVIAGCTTIGLHWSQIQWLATALTFGLAFGLQEMFANFVAGLILLFERPIRVGDIITIDDTTGVVSRIRIRATTITNWDRKELIVPNKEFITGKLLNWTLSDHVNRITIEVGVAYGSNTELARELLLKAACEHPLTLENPAPVATFERFGDSSLILCLRAFLPSLENRLQVVHELHTAIDKLFREAGIEIPFPQRDLRLRMVTGAAELQAAATAAGRDSDQRGVAIRSGTSDAPEGESGQDAEHEAAPRREATQTAA